MDTRLVLFLGLVGGMVWAAPAHAQIMESTSLPQETAVFQMADGKFFHPGTGRIGASEAEARGMVETSPILPTTPPVPPLEIPQELPLESSVDLLVQAIRTARAELTVRIAADSLTNGARVTKKEDEWRDIMLAIWNRETNTIRYVAAQKNGTGLREDDPADIHVRSSNGVNSEMVVDGGEKEFVVAIRYPILQALNTKRTLFSLTDVVYTPYAKAIHTPALVQEGETYLDTTVQTVMDRLRAEGVRSKAFPDRLLVDVVDPAMMKAIAAIEHLGERALETNPTHALERFFVLLGGNTGDTFNYARSSAGALGLVQFIPSTYTRLAARKEWGLEPSFERAMQSHENALRAQAIYLDVLLTEFSQNVRDTYLVNPELVREYIVAAYNGGSGRVKRAVPSWNEVFNGEKAREITTTRRKYESAFAEAESLRQKTLKEKNATKRAALQKKLDTQRATYRRLKNTLETLEASILRKETIGYIEKYRLTKADERFTHRETTVMLVQPAASSLHAQ